MKFNYLQLLAVWVALLIAVPARAQTVATGQFETGAYYHMQVPPGWTPQDGLVIWNHGFDLNPPKPDVDLGPLAQAQLIQGYAVAATSYRQNGWALFHTLGDLRDLVHEFEVRFGVPEKIYLTGGSMGGLVSIQGLEAANLGNVVGVYSLCGALGGGHLWDAALDLRLAYDAVCQGVEGAEIEGGAKGLPFRVPPEAYANDDVTAALGFSLGKRLNACTGVLQPAPTRSPGQQERLDRLMAVLDLPNEAFFITVMSFATVGLADLVYDPDKLNGEIGTSNINVDYGDAQLNANIQRVDADDLPRLELLNSYKPSGATGDARVLAIHTDEDGLVPVESLHSYASVAPAQDYAYAVVDEEVPSHCEFTPAEGLAGWNLLTAWVEDEAMQPDTAQLQSTCQSLTASGILGPCRYAPDYQVASLATVIPPRDVPDYPVDRGIFGAWLNPARPGEGWVLELLDGNRVLVYWFTYPPEGAAGNQQWLMGVGQVEGNTVHATLVEPAGRAFGEPLPVALNEWGEITFIFSSDTEGLVRWTGPPAYGTRQATITRLAGLRGDGSPPLQIGTPPPAVDFVSSVSGSWYSDAWPAEGWQITFMGETALVYWFTYDPNGQPAWIMGVGSLEPNLSNIQVDEAYIFTGTHFGADFNPQDAQPVPWGSMRFEFDSCAAGTLFFNSTLPGFGAGERQIERLTLPAGWSCPALSTQ